MTHSPNLLIIGASARAAALSALRAGLRPRAVDLFADADLARACPAARVSDYPRGFLQYSDSTDCDGWLYTGGLECHPSLVDHMARRLPLRGHAGDVLRRVRDPFQVAAVLRAAGLAAPDVAQRGDHLPRDGSWLRKRLRASGGAHVAPWTGDASGAADNRGHYFQRRIEGRHCSAVYVAAAGRARLLGVTEQLTGTPWCRAEGFRYAGSIGPLDVHPAAAENFAALGNCLAAEFALVGLFGVDAVLSDNAVWPVEVNPRYTASIEVLERSLGEPFLRWHLAACRELRLPSVVAARPTMVQAKAVLYAHRPLHITAGVSARLLAKAQRPHFLDGPLADIPPAGTQIPASRPVLTVFARGARQEQARARLREAIGDYERQLYSGG